MAIDERIDDLIASLGGFHRSWLVYLGLELGLFARLREAGSDGMTPAELAAATGTHQQAVEAGRGQSMRTTSPRSKDDRLIGHEDIA